MNNLFITDFLSICILGYVFLSIWMAYFYALRLEYPIKLFCLFESPSSGVDYDKFDNTGVWWYRFAFWYRIWYWVLRNKRQATKYTWNLKEIRHLHFCQMILPGLIISTRSMIKSCTFDTEYAVMLGTPACFFACLFLLAHFSSSNQFGYPKSTPVYIETLLL